MGILCESCDRLSLLENEPQKTNIIYDNDDGFELPKENLSTEPKIEEKILMNFEDDEKDNDKPKEEENDKDEDKEKEKEKEIQNQVISNEKQNEKKKKKPKSSLSKIKCKSSKLVIADRRKFKEPRREVRSNSLPTPHDPDLYHELFKDDSQRKSKRRSVNDIKVFKRKKKKSTTLMENKSVLKQLFNIQLSIPVSQDLLVMEQRGNPSENYLRGEKIGSGSFGTVYVAKNIVFNNKVAMKIIPKHERMDNQLIKNEIDILKKLSHPNIVRIYEFYETKNNFYLINEFCNEGELYNYVNKSVLNEQQLSILFYQVFSGLCYLHENEILHRDIKPENILISKKEIDLLTDEEYFWIEIIDFGTAEIFGQDKNIKEIVGSSYYIAPEVLNNEYSEKCDTWSVGVILYMFLVGSPPFNGKNTEEIINSIRTKTFDENNEILNKYSEEVRDLVKGLLNKNPDERLSAKQALNHKWFQKFNGRKLFGNFMEKDIQPIIDCLFNYSFHSKLQQLVIAFLVHNLPTTDSSRNILKLYRYFNISGDCKLTKNELINGLNKYRSENEVKEKVDLLFLLLDGDNNGFIEYEEFLRACIDKKEIFTDEYLKYAFKFLDKENNETLSVEQISSTFLKEDSKVNKMFEIAIAKDLNEVDADGDGNINFFEFKELMTKTYN